MLNYTFHKISSPSKAFFGALLIVCLQAIANDTSSVSGDKGNWTARWSGQGITATTSGLSDANQSVGRAVNAAKTKNFAEFAQFFSNIDAKNPPENVVSLFEEWQAASDFGFLIGTEVILSNPEDGENELRAVTVIPALRENTKENQGEHSGLKARVVFQRRSGDGWKLLPDALDKRIEEQLLHMDSRWVFKPDANVFRSEEEAKVVFKQRRLEEQEKIIQSFRDKKTKPAIVNQLKQAFDLENKGIEIKTWKDWTNHYHAQILNPPVRFDVLDHFESDFSTPVSAYRSFWHTMRHGNAEALIQNSDESGQVWLSETGVRPGAKAEAYYSRTGLKLNECTVLLTATDTFEGKDYVLVLARHQEKESPKTGRLALDVVIFKRTKSGFIHTRDLDIGSPFGNVLGVARANGTLFLPYPEFHEKAKMSDLPPHFYTIQE